MPTFVTRPLAALALCLCLAFLSGPPAHAAGKLPEPNRPRQTGASQMSAKQMSAPIDSFSLWQVGDRLPRELRRTLRRAVGDGPCRKPLVLVFFTTWCPNCHPLVQGIATSLQSLPEEGVRLLLVGREESPEVLAAWQEAHGWHLPLWADPERRLYARFATRYVPRTYVIDSKGRVVYLSDNGDPATLEALCGRKYF